LLFENYGQEVGGWGNSNTLLVPDLKVEGPVSRSLYTVVAPMPGGASSHSRRAIDRGSTGPAGSIDPTFPRGQRICFDPRTFNVYKARLLPRLGH